MKTYRGIRDPDCRVLVLDAPAGEPFDAAGTSREAAPSNGTGDHPPARRYELSVPPDLLTKPPGPFDWGGGTETPGAHYLSIAILADLLGPTDRAGIKALLPFLRRFLARLPKDGFEISDTVFYALFSAIAGGVRAEVHAANGTRGA